MLDGRGMSDPLFARHTIYEDGVAMVQEFNRHGYVVDFCDAQKVTGKDVDWSRYAIVVDGINNLKDAPLVAGQKKIHFTTYIHWLTWNQAELKRIQWFKERTGILVPMNRQNPSIVSDEYADYLTYYGTQLQPDSYSPKPIKHLINLCGLCGPAPEYQKKDMAKARNKFMWLGGGGMLHKGLDIAVDAFRQMPEAELYIGGNLRDEPRFWEWVQPILAKHPNIHSLGWVDNTSPAFNAIADQCIGAVYPSGAEGGPGSVARMLFNGLIPIVTPAALVRAETLGYVIRDTTAADMIASTIEHVRTVMHLPEAELIERSDAVREFARTYHTREAFNESFGRLIDLASR